MVAMIGAISLTLRGVPVFAGKLLPIKMRVIRLMYWK